MKSSLQNSGPLNYIFHCTVGVGRSTGQKVAGLVQSVAFPPLDLNILHLKVN